MSRFDLLLFDGERDVLYNTFHTDIFPRVPVHKPFNHSFSLREIHRLPPSRKLLCLPNLIYEISDERWGLQ